MYEGRLEVKWTTSRRRYVKKTDARTLGGVIGGRRLHRSFRRRCAEAGNGRQDGGTAGDYGPGESDAGNSSGKVRKSVTTPSSAPARSDSQPGSMVLWLPLHLPRCAGWWVRRNHRRNEDGGGQGHLPNWLAPSNRMVAARAYGEKVASFGFGMPDSQPFDPTSDRQIAPAISQGGYGSSVATRPIRIGMPVQVRTGSSITPA